MKAPLKKEVKQWAENFVEHSNAYLHALFLFLALFVSVICPYFELQDPLTIIIELLGLLFAEVIVLQAKDSILQNKVNIIKVNTTIRAGALFKAADFGIDALHEFFQSTYEDFFISGIALNSFIHNNRQSIERLVEAGKTVYILISDPDSLSVNTLYYHGSAKTREEGDRWIIDMKHCVCKTIASILNSEILLDGVRTGKVKVRLSAAPFTTSFIAHDIVNLKGNKQAIQATFYQYGCTNPHEEPGIMVDSIDEDFWYKIFRTAALKQWDDAKEVEGVEQLNELHGYTAKPVVYWR